MDARNLVTDPVYLVVEDNVLFLTDIVETLMHHQPNATVHAVRSLAAAREVAGHCPRLTAAFLSLNAPTIIQAGLALSVEAKGGTIIFIDGAAGPGTDTPETWVRLPLPFSASTIKEVVTSLALSRR